jgi:hypothetical protein
MDQREVAGLAASTEGLGARSPSHSLAAAPRFPIADYVSHCETKSKNSKKNDDVRKHGAPLKNYGIACAPLSFC